MIKITIQIEGMQCGMCEAHINDAIRNSFRVKKVASSRSKCETVIIAEDDINEQKLKDVIEEAGYKAVRIEKEHYEKKRVFSRLKK